MSHFTVLVVTKDGSETSLAKALQPFHEFECTGANDEYVVDVDETETARAQFAGETTTCLKDAKGELHTKFDSAGNWKIEFSRPGLHGRREGFVPAGYTEVEVPTSKVQSFADFASGWYGVEIVKSEGVIDRSGQHRGGFVLVNEAGEVVRVVDRTNPNKRWDWWVVGGRWKGMLRANEGAKTASGRPGLMGSHYSADGVDACRKGDLALDQMRALACSDRRQSVRTAYDAIKSKTGLSDAEVTQKWVRFVQLRSELFAQWEADQGGKGRPWDWMRRNPEFHGLEEAGIAEIGPWGFDAANVPPEEPDPLAWIDKAPPLQTFAFLTAEGEWVERGRVGWFATVSDEKAGGSWEDEYARLLSSVDDDHWVTVVDCHI